MQSYKIIVNSHKNLENRSKSVRKSIIAMQHLRANTINTHANAWNSHAKSINNLLVTYGIPIYSPWFSRLGPAGLGSAFLVSARGSYKTPSRVRFRLTRFGSGWGSTWGSGSAQFGGFSLLLPWGQSSLRGLTLAQTRSPARFAFELGLRFGSVHLCSNKKTTTKR